MAQPLIRVQESHIHGAGVFAVQPIPQATRIIEYTGEIITNRQADRRAAEKNDDKHTLFFSLNKQKIIDAGVGGNESRFINHSCDPNCESHIERGHIYIVSLRDIAVGEEITYDYKLFLDRKLEKGERALYVCHCNSIKCRGTLLDSKVHPLRKRQASK